MMLWLNLHPLEHIDLCQVLEQTRKFGLKMNQKKCTFGVTAGQFLGFLVHERGIEIGLRSQEVVKIMTPPTMKRELQQLIGKINFVRKFISNLSGQIESFMGLVKIRSDSEFRWGPNQQKAFEKIKEYLSRGVLLVSPRGKHIISPFGCPISAPTIWQNTKLYATRWSYYLKLVQRQWRFWGFKVSNISAHGTL